MSRHAQIEEIDDDPEEVDISTLLSPTSSFSVPPDPPFPSFPANFTNPLLQQTQTTQYPPPSDPTLHKTYQCLYPVYFDANRSRALGRRVKRELAVPNPLAREIVDAAAALGLRTVFEPGKTHPKDWGNPGRVRVALKDDGARGIENKFCLYQEIAKYLQAHPTTRESPLKLRIPNMPFDGKIPEPPAVPRGWKMGSVLPLHSPALSGGGVGEDLFKEMMQGMGMPVDAGGPVAGEKLEKKEKKEKKKGKR
ncbi:signal recognition particle subunit [Rhizina undulata]